MSGVNDGRSSLYFALGHVTLRRSNSHSTMINHAFKFAMLHAGSLRARACIVDDVGMLVVVFALVVKSVAMVFVDHGVRSFARRDRRLTTCWGLWHGALRAFGMRFGILVLLRFFFRGYQFVVYISTYKRFIESLCCI